MKHGMLSTFVLLSVVTYSAVARGQSIESDRTRHADPSGAPGMTQTPGSSWESWLHHGNRDFTPKPYVPSRSPDLGAPAASLSPSIGPGSGLLGPKAVGAPERITEESRLYP
jgi:hypothetical protein